LPTILVADDNSNIQKMVILAFKGEGIDVVAVGNGDAAVKKTIEIIPDLVLADIFMPVRSGYEVCEFLKLDPRFSHIPVVLLAGAFDPFDAREAQRVGADGVLKKPFVPPDPLVALVKELLAKSAERLVAVSVPAQSEAVVAKNASQAPVASSAPAPVSPTLVPHPFVPPPFARPAPPASMQESAEVEEMEDQTLVAPVRVFSIPVVPPESGHEGGADAFGSMLDTSPPGTVIPPVQKFNEPSVEAEHEIQDAPAHSAFEGFSAWRPRASSAPVTEDEEATEPRNQFTPSNRDLMGRVWEVDPSIADQSPDETVIEPRDDLSPLTQSAQHVTSARDESGAAVETSAAPKPEPEASSRVSDWRSAFTQAPEQAAQIVKPAPLSMSAWRKFTSPAEPIENERNAASASALESETPAQPVAVVESEQIAGATSSDGAPRSFDGREPKAQASTFFVEPDDTDTTKLHEPVDAEFGTEHESSTTIAELADIVQRDEVTENTHAAEEPPSASAFSSPETSEWIAAMPSQLSPEDTTTIARSLVEQLAPSAVESVATSFPVPIGAAADPRVVEDIVARVVERMQPQILEIITREVLRPVVEAIVRRQLEQQLPE